jgi:hypothetical protein
VRGPCSTGRVSRRPARDTQGLVFLRSDLLGGCSVILFLIIISVVSRGLGLPLRLARSLLVGITLACAYLVSDAVIPDYNRPWGVVVTTLCLAIAPIHIGWESLADDYRARDMARRCTSAARKHEDNEKS